jgi:hypothetical protein
MVALLIKSYLARRAGIVLTPHQFRHLGAKIMLDGRCEAPASGGLPTRDPA